MSLLDAAGIMNGGIWANSAFDFDSPLKDLLDTGKYTLEQILAEDELLQELRGMNPQLIEFFSKEETVAGLLQYIILSPSTTTTTTKTRKGEKQTQEKDGENDPAHEKPHKSEDGINGVSGKDEPTKEPGKWLHGEDPSEDDEFNNTQQPPKSQKDLDDDLRIRFPYMACEVICCEIKGVVDIIVDGFVPLLGDDDDDDDDDETSNQHKNGETTQPISSSDLLSDDARGKPMLDLLFSMLYDSKYGEMDDYRAGYFEKVLSVLLRNRSSDIAEYLNEGGGRGNENLMSAMFQHLYSHSLMQVVQRLLLPAPPRPPRPEVDDDEHKDENTNECEDLFKDPLEGADIDGMDTFRCNWSESAKGLEMVLDCLIGDADSSRWIGMDDNGVDEEERKLNLYRNSSEVLITIIQNSPLTSVTMCTLTTSPVLEKLIKAATYVEKGSEFSRHDSRLTCAMNVLESLILQLGGYGSVGTIIFSDEDDEGEDLLQPVVREQIIPEESKPSTETKTEASDEQPHPFPSRKSRPKYATPDTLIHLLPKLLLSLSNFLTNPVTEKWVSPMQFSKSKPQQILGASRLRIVRLLESLVLLGNPMIDSQLCESSCLEICLDLFWKFQWCSMLHQSVANLLVHIFEGQNARSDLQAYFLVRCNLIGRLMYSFYTKQAEGGLVSVIGDSNAELSESILGQKDSDSELSPTTSSIVSDRGSSTITEDVLPVSDDDVDVAIEQQQEQGGVSIAGLEEDVITSDEKANNVENVVGDTSIATSQNDEEQILRVGYMGHVIIICQALIHAISEDDDENLPTMDDGSDELSKDMRGRHDQFENEFSTENDQRSGLPKTRSRDDEIDDDDSALIVLDDDDDDNEVPSEPLVLARLVKTHPLAKIWEDFAAMTLNEEIAKQTTPLGGYQASTLGSDPLHMHRPGLEDDSGFDDDDVEAPPLPQRGVLVDGDVIDMTDNDLEIAANMMAGLQVAGRQGSNQTTSNTPHNGYIFDDPLGGGRFGDFDDVDDMDGDSSSDEEPEMLENTRTSSSGSGDNEAPVMDLFAGNFEAFDAGEGFSDFANFDNAFADAQDVDDHPDKEEKNNFDSVFGDVKSHDILLDDLDNPAVTENGIFDDPATVDGDVETDNAEVMA